ncbi:hypothetical protein MD484_g3326, partial [Candolleomyces efflorescens]
MLHESLGSDSWPREVTDLIIPPLQFKAIYMAEDLNFSWKKLNLKLEENVAAQLNRSLRIEVEEDCRPWCEVDNARELVDVWHQCVECHNDVFEKTGLLHRNISNTSIMFYRSDGKVRGVLKDWDLAAPNGAKDCFVPKSLIFTAIDLLDGSGKHKYCHRHDLEAFFYAFTWAVVHYNLKTKSVEPTRFWILHHWAEGTKTKKISFFTPKKHQNWGYRAIRPEFRQIFHIGIRPLWCLFNSAFQKLGYWEKVHIYVDHATCGGALAYDTFIAVVRKLQEDLTKSKACKGPCGK